MNVTLGTGKAVHLGHEIPGYATSPECGGNRATERYSETAQEVTCKKCLKIAAKLVEIDAVSEAPKTEEPPITEAAAVAEVEAVAEVAIVNIDMQSRSSGLVTFDKGQMLVGRQDGKWYAEMPYAEFGPPFFLLHRDLRRIVAAGVRRCGESRKLSIRTDREY